MGRRSAPVARRGALWLVVDWASGDRIGWGPWRSWSRFRRAVESWRKDDLVNAVRVLDRRPTKAEADMVRTPAGRP